MPKMQIALPLVQDQTTRARSPPLDSMLRSVQLVHILFWPYFFGLMIHILKERVQPYFLG